MNALSMLHWLGRWRGTALAGVTAAALILLSDSFVFESVVVPSTSMQPTILANERLFLRRVSLSREPIARYDVVVIDNHRLHTRLAKRVIGLPGDRVRLEDSWKVYINDRPLSYSSQNAEQERVEAGDHRITVRSDGRAAISTRFAARDVTLGPDQYFVLGDNRLDSDDSRDFGPVTRAEIQGTLTVVWYSFDLEQRRLRIDRLLHSVTGAASPL